jgi:hypothetical protein
VTEPRDDLDGLTRQLEDAAGQLRTGELTPDQAASLVEECARLAALAGAELDRLARDAAPDPRPGQGELL